MNNTTSNMGSGGTDPISSNDTSPGVYAGRTDRPASESIPELIKRLAQDLSYLMSKEIELAKTEIREAGNKAKAGVVSMGAGAAVTYAGVLMIVMGCVLALGLVIPLWVAAFVVGGVVAIIGVVMLKAGQKKLEPASFAPTRTVDAVKSDSKMAKEKIS